MCRNDACVHSSAAPQVFLVLLAQAYPLKMSCICEEAERRLSRTIGCWHIICIDEMHTREASMGTVSFDFQGEVVIVTGGSRGLGLEIAHAFGYAGAQVVITARREQWLIEAEKFLKDRAIAVRALTCDVADAGSV